MPEINVAITIADRHGNVIPPFSPVHQEDSANERKGRAHPDQRQNDESAPAQSEASADIVNCEQLLPHVPLNVFERKDE